MTAPKDQPTQETLAKPAKKRVRKKAAKTPPAKNLSPETNPPTRFDLTTRDGQMEVYNFWRMVPDWAKKPYTPSKGVTLTSIDPQWRIDVLTTVFGLVGYGWGFEVTSRPDPITIRNVTTFLIRGRIWYKIGDTIYHSTEHTGGAAVYAGGGVKPDDVMKCAETGAFSKACQSMGIGGHVYCGQHDGAAEIHNLETYYPKEDKPTPSPERPRTPPRQNTPPKSQRPLQGDPEPNPTPVREKESLAPDVPLEFDAQGRPTLAQRKNQAHLENVLFVPKWSPWKKTPQKCGQEFSADMTFAEFEDATRLWHLADISDEHLDAIITTMHQYGHKLWTDGAPRPESPYAYWQDCCATLLSRGVTPKVFNGEIPTNYTRPGATSATDGVPNNDIPF